MVLQYGPTVTLVIIFGNLAISFEQRLGISI